MAKGLIIEPKFMWNIDANVGPGMPNRPEDVQLVQFGYACKALNPRGAATSEEKAIYAAVKPGAAYTGAVNDPLTVAIKHHQKTRPGSTQDGVVSAIKGSSGGYGTYAFLLSILNNNMCDVMESNWPRLDKHPMCPPALRDSIKRVLDPR